MQKCLMRGITVFAILIALSCSDHLTQSEDLKGKAIQSKEPVQLNWIGHWKGEGRKGAMLKEIAREFEFENQDIRVNLKYPEEAFQDCVKFSEMKYYAKLITSQKSYWDLINIDDDADIVSANLDKNLLTTDFLVDLSTYPEIRNSVYQEIIDKPEFRSKWNNKLPGIAIDGTNGVLWCNKELAKRIGIDVKQFDMTFEDFEGYLKAVYSYNKSNGSNVIGIFEVDGFSLLDMIPRQLYYSEVGDYESITSDKYDNSKWAAFEKTIYALERLAQYEPIPNKEKYSWPKDNDYPLKGNCLFYPQGSWMYNIWLGMDSVAIKNMIPVQLPEFKKSETYLGEYRIVWAIPKNAMHIQEAIRLMKFIATPETADKWIRYTKSPTGIKNSIVSTSMGIDPYENFDYTINKKFLSTKLPFTVNNEGFFGKNSIKIKPNFRAILEGKVTANEFLRTIKAKLK